MDVDAVIENVLAHHGVKGMRWGVRRNPERAAARAAKKVAKQDKKFEKKAFSVNTYIEIHNRAGDHFNSRIDAINDKYDDAANKGHLLNPEHPAYKAYNKEANDLMRTSLEKAAASMGTNASGTKKIGVDVHPDPIEGGWRVVLKDVQHEDLSFRIVPQKDKQGRILSVTIDAMMAGTLAVGEILEHYGVKGMHWGVRRERSQDVTVTTKRKNKTKARGGQDVPIHKDAVKKVEVAQIKKKSGINALSDSELKAYANRLQLEANVARLESEQKSAGSKWIRKFLKDSGNQTENQFVNETSQAMGKALGKAAVRKGTKVAVKTGVKAALG